MYRSSAKRLSAFIACVGFCLSGATALLAAQQSQSPKVSLSVKHGTSKPLREYQMAGPVIPRPPREVKNKIRPMKASAPGTTDPSVQRQFGGSAPPAELLQFDGGSDDEVEEVTGGRLAPPDTNGDVGPSHYVQYINIIVNMYDKEGTLLLGPLPGNVFWEGLGTECETENWGDPIVLYDQLADRWFVSQFAFPNIPGPPYIQCVAVSVTGDPTGAYHQYQFNLPDTYLNDYPKFGVWPDGYYMTFNGFDVFGGGFQGGAIAFDRDAMLNGDPATMIEFNTGEQGGVLPSDMDGMIPPPPGAPNVFMNWDVGPERLHMWEFHADFDTPADSTFTQLPDLPVDPFVFPVCGNFRDQCVPQLDSGELLETLSQATMFRLAYRNFGTHQSLVTNHTVGVSAGGGGNFAGVRWYELRIPGPEVGEGASNPWIVYQQQTYAPDSNWRWMGSIAQDINGNIALGYSISSDAMHPSIAVAGRLASDPLNELGTEDIFLAGGGSQSDTSSRWGDYSSMNIDPSDDCTFWYTQEYCDAPCVFDWKTRIAAFKFPSCTTGPSGTLEGTVTDGTNPIEGANVTAGASGTTTDAAGHYSMTLPVGTYDMTVTKYGFFPASADDVPVNEGETTVQDFTLEAAPSQPVNGTVKDSITNWPLYAVIQISGPGYPGATLWTDPVTGYYSVTLVDGITYTFVINAVSAGYEQGGGTVPLGGALGNAPFLVQNWTLDANLETCNAPGYTPDIAGLYEAFDGGVLPPGWTVINNSTGGEIYPTEWVIVEGSDPCGNYSGNLTGGTGPFAVANSDCPGPSTVMDTELITPSVDMSSFASAAIRFNEDFRWLGDNADVDVSVDGGSSWTNVLSQTSDARGPREISIDITGLAAGESNVQARFHNYNAAWAWWWQVDNILLGQAGCIAGSGGLVVGNVIDGSTDLGLNGATVQNIGGGSTTTFATPDPAQEDGFYILYAEAGPQDFEASLTNYQPDQESTLVVPGSTVRLDFELNSGNLSVSPTALNGRVDPGGTEQQPVTVTNTGAAEATFELLEINAPLLTTLTRGFAPESLRRQAIARLPQGKDGPEHTALTTRGLPRLQNLPGALDRLLAAGDVLSSFDSGLAIGWGVATSGVDVWISNPSYIGGGDDLDHRFTSDGADTGDTIDETGVGLWAGDGAFNPNTGNFWRVAVGGDNCLYEFDPNALELTGNTICGSPWTDISQRGLAYDLATDSFFVGGWNEGIVYHIDTDGNVIDSAFVGIEISGMAYSSANGHLLVMRNDVAGDDVTVLDALDNYNVLGAFQVTDGGSPVFADFEQAGMEMDCVGNLWAINQATQVVYRIESGEAASCESDIPWFAVNPNEGTVSPNGGTMDVSADWDAGSLLPGLQMAQLTVKTNTPHQVAPIPVTLTVRFLDVPDENQFADYIYAAAGAGVMFGGPPVCPPGVLYFCPEGDVTRADMAGYLWRAINGRNTPPPVYQNIFNDVTFNDYNSFYIQGIFDLGITAGCSAVPPLYCPDDAVTRAQMSAFIWRGEHGDEPPPACTGTVFDDVPCPSLFADYIEGLAAEGVTAGCGGGNFCPNDPISNGQMSVFLVKAFGIPVVILPSAPFSSRSTGAAHAAPVLYGVTSCL